MSNMPPIKILHRGYNPGLLRVTHFSQAIRWQWPIDAGPNRIWFFQAFRGAWGVILTNARRSSSFFPIDLPYPIPIIAAFIITALPLETHRIVPECGGLVKKDGRGNGHSPEFPAGGGQQWMI
ncbi:MAG: hypothetical protein NTY64_08230 [Deltaproteobacteria bacterium]|nr:hypothetical protein [Deltaproteobacteria bacterium]